MKSKLLHLLSLTFVFITLFNFSEIYAAPSSIKTDSETIPPKKNSILLISTETNISGELKLAAASDQISQSGDNKPIETQKPWLFLHRYDATYDIESDGEKLGSAKRQLSESKGIWKLLMSTSLKKWLLTLKSEEYSEFVIENAQLFTREFYTSSKVSFKKAKTITQSFNWEKKLESGSKNEDNWQLPLDELLYDRMSHLVMLRADLLNKQKDFNYRVSYKGKHQTYSYVDAGTQKVTTPFGEFLAIRLDRQKGDDSSFSIWLSPELNYFPIKIAQFEQDKPDIILILSNLNYF